MSKQVQKNLIATINEYLNRFNKELDTSTNKLIEVVSYLGIGFFSGILIKKYFYYLIIILATVIATGYFCDQYNIILINWNKLHELTGISSNDTIITIFEHFSTIFKNNMACMTSLLLGFLIGYKIG